MNHISDDIDMCLNPIYVREDMVISQLLRRHPEAAEALRNYGLGCVSCPSAQRETIKQACAVHGLDVDDLLEYLNEYIDEMRYMF